MAFRDLIPWSDRNRRSVVGSEDNPVTALRNEVNRIFDDFYDGLNVPSMDRMRASMARFNPKTDVKETDKEIQVTTELPGMAEDDVDVTISDDVLTIKGEKKEEKKDEDKERNYYRTECSYGSFERSVPLPTEVDVDKADAVFKNGVLKLTVPKVPEEKLERKKVEIKKQ